MPLTDLEKWLTREGDKVVRKKTAAKTCDVLDPRERVLYEFWLFDTEQRNGGVSQYFCNWGFAQWDILSHLASQALPSFVPFAARVNSVVDGSDDPYQAIINSLVDLDEWYEQYQIRLVRELQTLVRSAG